MNEGKKAVGFGFTSLQVKLSGGSKSSIRPTFVRIPLVLPFGLRRRAKNYFLRCSVFYHHHRSFSENNIHDTHAHSMQSKLIASSIKALHNLEQHIFPLK